MSSPFASSSVSGGTGLSNGVNGISSYSSYSSVTNPPGSPQTPANANVIMVAHAGGDSGAPPSPTGGRVTTSSLAQILGYQSSPRSSQGPDFSPGGPGSRMAEGSHAASSSGLFGGAGAGAFSTSGTAGGGAGSSSGLFGGAEAGAFSTSGTGAGLLGTPAGGSSALDPSSTLATGYSSRSLPGDSSLLNTPGSSSKLAAGEAGAAGPTDPNGSPSPESGEHLEGKQLFTGEAEAEAEAQSATARLSYTGPVAPSKINIVTTGWERAVDQLQKDVDELKKESKTAGLQSYLDCTEQEIKAVQQSEQAMEPKLNHLQYCFERAARLRAENTAEVDRLTNELATLKAETEASILREQEERRRAVAESLAQLAAEKANMEATKSKKKKKKKKKAVKKY
uniref:Uncharacterized protein n=1 Tax=Eutreptiella gymnastica TaxID=73025 RepID=A0A7S4G3N2_9EUGL